MTRTTRVFGAGVLASFMLTGCLTPQQATQKIDNAALKISNPSTQDAAVMDLGELAIAATEKIEATRARGGLPFAWTIVAMRAYETITMSYTPDADVFRPAANETLALANKAQQACHGNNGSIGPDQTNLCGPAFAALSLNDTRRAVWDFSRAVESGDWPGVTKSAADFDSRVSSHWPQFEQNIAKLEGGENDVTPFRDRAKRTACSLYVAHSETSFLPTRAAEGSDHLNAKQAYWSAMANAADFLGVTTSSDKCISDPGGYACKNQKSIVLAQTC